MDLLTSYFIGKTWKVGVPHTDIGIPSFTAQELEEFNKQEVHLGPMPMDPEFREDIEKTLKEQDEIHQRQIEGENQVRTNENQVNNYVLCVQKKYQYNFSYNLNNIIKYILFRQME
jgi:hypothetical protein